MRRWPFVTRTLTAVLWSEIDCLPSFMIPFLHIHTRGFSGSLVAGRLVGWFERKQGTIKRRWMGNRMLGKSADGQVDC